MEVPTEREWKLNENDILIMTTRDSGPGGQHRNKTESCVIMRHVPTGIEAKASARCQHQNKRTARAMLEARVKNHLEDKLTEEVDKRRQEDRGSGMRGDKVRTYRDKDDVVTDHRTENKIRLKDVKLGKLEGLWR